MSDFQSAHRPKPQLSLQYLGQEGFLIQTDGLSILCDPYLSDYVDRNCSSPEVAWIRRYPVPVQPESLNDIDYVFCSHDHADHTDPDTIAILARVNPRAQFIGPPPVVRKFRQIGIPADRIRQAEAGKEILLAEGCTVRPVPAAHEELHPDAQGCFAEVGYRFTFGSVTLFHAGDCCVYDGLVEQLGTVDIALLPINGRDYFRLHHDIIGNMDGREAVELAGRIGARLLVPMHFDLYAVNGCSAASFVSQMEESGTRIPYHVFQPGERYVYAE